ncbi:hypothetical protein B0A52_03553 [Exophiala mesophila]|uniref:Methyltransferase domain-containing protein n=1 Tax=Exophiala mesophila TaxID=212818 RepID=A0A438N610_EXOME|nr:hypothetical protein B0A52_03553 [Exophiala mesophila]
MSSTSTWASCIISRSLELPTEEPSKTACVVSSPNELPNEEPSNAVPDVYTGDDYDSSFSDDDLSYTTSLPSSVQAFPIENGRTYHAYKDGKYWGSNDEEANEHLAVGHFLYKKTLGGRPYLAPISPNPTNILDLGTGTGSWVTDVADQHPTAIVTGTDLSPIQPSFVPPNTRFEIDDAEAEWTYPENLFDLIHIRGLHGSIEAWPGLYAQCLRCLKPGGYLEQSEYSPLFTSDDNSIPQDGAIAAWNSVWPECHRVLGREMQILDGMKQYMIDAGLQSVTEHKFKWPLGDWPKDPVWKHLGHWAKAHAESGLENWTLRPLTNHLGWTAEEVHVLCAKVRQDLRDRSIHAIQRMNTVYGRKGDTVVF